MKHRAKAEVLPTHTRSLFHTAVQKAAALLLQVEVVALPTETVYGLAANALNARAVERIFRIKGRPAHNPIIVHVGNTKMARQCVSAWPPIAAKLARAFWPGPLTLVLPRAAGIPDVVTAGGATVGVRWPSPPFIQAVIRQCGVPLAAPSANPANRVSSTTAEHVRKYLGDQVPLIIDGGPSQIGIESTVLDVSVPTPRLLRPGMIHELALLAVTGKLLRGSGKSSAILKSPGQLPRHYAPKAKLVLCSWRDENDLRKQCSRFKVAPSRIQIIAHSRIPSAKGFGGVTVLPHNAAAFGRAIYAELHKSDEAGAKVIVVESLPAQAEWRAIADRLQRATATAQS
jgi:L-threonylcarbamoyladenylate synthase